MLKSDGNQLTIAPYTRKGTRRSARRFEGRHRAHTPYRSGYEYQRDGAVIDEFRDYGPEPVRSTCTHTGLTIGCSLGPHARELTLRGGKWQLRRLE